MTQTLRRWAILVEMQVKLLLQNRDVLVGSLGLAVVSMLIFGSLLSGGTDPLPIAVVDRDGSPVAAQVVAAFGATEGIDVVTPCPTCDALQLLKDGDVAAVVTLPAGFGQAVATGHATAEVHYDGSNPARGGQAQGIIAGVLGGVNRAITGAAEPIAVAPQEIDRRVIRQIDWLTPGMAGMMVMWANLAVGATIIAWRERGILKRLATTPLRPSVLIITQIAARLAFSCVQVVVLLAIARVVFGVRIAGNYWDLALLIIVATLAILAFGLVIGAFVPRSESAQSISTLIAFPMMFLGGSYFDTTAAPDFLQPVIQAMPLTHINEAMRQIILFGAGVADLQRQFAILLAWLAVSLLVAVRAFRWHAA
jgi:ABC-2 type transport system permease protein